MFQRRESAKYKKREKTTYILQLLYNIDIFHELKQFNLQFNTDAVINQLPKSFDTGSPPARSTPGAQLNHFLTNNSEVDIENFLF